MTLDEYLSSLKGDKKLTDAEFGAKVGLSQSQISRLRNGKAKPSFKAIHAIAKATNQKVKPKDWFEVREGEAA